MLDMAMGFGGLGAFGHTAGLAGDLARSRQAVRDAQFLEGINGAAADSATRKRAPDAFARFVEDQSNGQPIDTIYIRPAVAHELVEQLAVVDDLVVAAELRVVVLHHVEAVRALRDDLLHAHAR